MASSRSRRARSKIENYESKRQMSAKFPSQRCHSYSRTIRNTLIEITIVILTPCAHLRVRKRSGAKWLRKWPMVQSLINAIGKRPRENLIWGIKNRVLEKCLFIPFFKRAPDRSPSSKVARAPSHPASVTIPQRATCSRKKSWTCTRNKHLKGHAHCGRDGEWENYSSSSGKRRFLYLLNYIWLFEISRK